MAVTYGFFNSVDGDRKYDADQMSNYFEGLVGDGVLKNVDNELQVVASSGLTIAVKSGRAIIKNKWLKNNSLHFIEITPDSSYPYIELIVIDYDYSERKVSINTVKGTPASSPVAPSITRTDDRYMLVLASILVPANASAISQSNITDKRATSDCGWVTGLITQLSTDTLNAQWESIYSEYFEAMQENFDDWMQLLVGDLNVSTFIQKYEKVYTQPADGRADVLLDMTGYTFNTSDIVNVYFNGLKAKQSEYFIGINGSSYYVVTTESHIKGTEILIEVLKSKVGFNAIVGSDEINLAGSDNNLLSGT